MDRLTEQNPGWIEDEFWTSAREPDDEEIYAVYRKLKSYEDAEEQGRLVRLPCKVGQTVWRVAKGLSIYRSGLHLYVQEQVATKQNVFDWARRDDFGKTVFLARQEAEKALEGTP